MIDPSEAATLRSRARLGRVLRDKWRVEELIGVGGMATVYSATHVNNGRRVALKMLHPELSMNPEVKSRFLREGYVANKVAHPGIVSILDDDTAEDGAVYLVMELLEGETLETLRERTGTLPPSEILSITDRLLDVLAAAHEKGIVHRDIKPENVFLTREGVVKVLDFGIARLREMSAAKLTMTSAGAIGTPAFMPPEQARGRWEQVGPATDIWAVGATMFTLATGRLVHEAETVNELLLAAMTNPAPPIEKVAPQLPTAFAKLVDKALAYELPNRWPDARAMQTALRKAYQAQAAASALPLDKTAQGPSQERPSPEKKPPPMAPPRPKPARPEGLSIASDPADSERTAIADGPESAAPARPALLKDGPAAAPIPMGKPDIQPATSKPALVPPAPSKPALVPPAAGALAPSKPALVPPAAGALAPPAAGGLGRGPLMVLSSSPLGGAKPLGKAPEQEAAPEPPEEDEELSSALEEATLQGFPLPAVPLPAQPPAQGGAPAPAAVGSGERAPEIAPSGAQAPAIRPGGDFAPIPLPSGAHAVVTGPSGVYAAVSGPSGAYAPVTGPSGAHPAMTAPSVSQPVTAPSGAHAAIQLSAPEAFAPKGTARMIPRDLLPFGPGGDPSRASSPQLAPYSGPGYVPPMQAAPMQTPAPAIPQAPPPAPMFGGQPPSPGVAPRPMPNAGLVTMHSVTMGRSGASGTAGRTGAIAIVVIAVVIGVLGGLGLWAVLRSPSPPERPAPAVTAPTSDATATAPGATAPAPPATAAATASAEPAPTATADATSKSDKKSPATKPRKPSGPLDRRR